MLKSLTDRNQALVNIGTSQEDRNLSAMAPDSFQVSDSDRSNFVRFLLELSPLITFYSKENKPAGSWENLLSKAPVIRMIELEAFRADELAQKFGMVIEDLNKKSNTTPVKTLIRGFQMVMGVLKKVERLRIVSESLPKFHEEVRKLIEDKFSPIRQRSLAYIRANLAPQDGIKILNIPDAKSYGAIWHENAITLETLGNNFDPDFRKLKALFSEVIDYLRLLQKTAREDLEELLGSGMIPPHISMLLGFQSLLKIAGEKLNRFTHRHLSYHFRQILGMHEKAGNPDHVYVAFQLAENIKGHFLPAGTKLNAGVDDSGNEKLYALDRSIQLSHLRIDSLKSLIHGVSPPGNPPFIKSELLTENRFIQSESKNSVSVEQEMYGSYFPGLAVAAPILQLDPANSLVKFRFRLSGSSFLGFKDKIFGLSENQWPDPGQENPAAYRIRKVNQMIRDLLRVTYSSEGGEYGEINSENIEFRFIYEDGQLAFNVLELEVLISPADPPVFPCEDPLFPQASKSSFPLFKFLLNPEKTHLYHAFVELVLERIEIDVNVLELTKLVLQNDLGPVSQESPFYPFGSSPIIGSCFLIGHPRVFNHQLQKVNINVEWFEVPSNRQGFPEYYSDYNFVKENGDFKVAVQILDQKQWKPRQKRQVISLFDTLPEKVVEGETPGHRISRVTQITGLDHERLKVRPAAPIQDLSTYNRQSLGGFLRLELVGPEPAFGHRLYPEVAARISTAGLAKKKLVPPPNEAFTPVARSISLDYSSFCKINLDKPEENSGELLYHLHPFGVDFLNGEFESSEQFFLPRYEMGAHLFLGFEELEVGRELSLFFEINEAGVLDYERPPEVEWSCMRDDQWHRIKAEEVLYDTTNGMTQSGLLRLVIQQGLDIENEVLPKDLTWLRCFSPLGSPFVSNLLDVRCQAASATFLDQGEDHHRPIESLPANSITGVYPGDVKIASILQPLASFGGRQKEESSDFFIRVGERIRHKDRALTAWDFETLVLEAFPEIRRVICLGHLDAQFRFKPGEILLIVLSNVSDIDRDLMRVPRVKPGGLKAIKEYLDSRIPSNVQVNVQNPSQEFVQANLAVKFRTGFNDVKYYKNKLNEELNAFLMPWLFDAKAEIEPGKHLYAAQIIRFLNSLEFIDYIANFSLFQFVGGKLVPPRKDKISNQIVRPKVPAAILLSQSQHNIEVIQGPGIPLDGIGLHSVGMDLSIPEDVQYYDEGIDYQAISKDLAIPSEGEEEGKDIFMKLKWI